MIRCTECGHENMDGLEYCDACGAKLPAAAVAEPAIASVSESEPTPVEESEPVVSGEASPAEVPPAAVPVSAPPPPVPASAAPQNAKLSIVRGGTVGKEFPLQGGDNLVGRWDPDSGAFPEVDLETDDPEARISRKHALICVGEQVTIEDIGSLNGTFVNRGRRLEPGSPVVLKDGDEIIIGKTFFKISLS
jgi:hypothetical protein